jgi:hypothetical protein
VPLTRDVTGRADAILESPACRTVGRAKAKGPKMGLAFADRIGNGKRILGGRKFY